MNVLKIINSDEYMYEDEEIKGNSRAYLTPSTNIIYTLIDEKNPIENELDKISVKEFLKSVRKNDKENISNFFGTLGLDEKKFTNMNQLLNLVDFIDIDLDGIELVDYVKRNPILKTKKIAIGENITIDDIDKVTKLMDKYKDIKDNIYVNLEYNFESISLNDCLKTINAIKEESDRIKEYNFSPMENIMYVYDKVRSRVYTKETRKESKLVSRNLANVLSGDKIVCVGYVQLFNSILKNLGIKTKQDYLMSNGPKGHVRTAIYVKDKKYDIDGLYYFDPTYDSKYSEQSINKYGETVNRKYDYDSLKYEYLNRYDYFAKTKKEIDRNLGFNYKYKSAPTNLKDLKKQMTNNAISKNNIMLYGWISKLFDYTNNKMIDLNDIFVNMTDEAKNKLTEIFDEINRKIPAEKMISILYNVRKIEYLEDNDIPYSIENIKKIYLDSNWNFEDKEYRYNSQDCLLSAMFGYRTTMEDTQLDSFNKFISKNNLEEQIKNAKNKILKLK